MARPSEKSFDIVKKWFLHNGSIPIESMNMTFSQKYRARLVYELYSMFLADKDIDLIETARRISARDYAQLLEQANNDSASTPQKIQELSKKYVDALRIKPGKVRGYSELSNDICMLNYIVDALNTDNLAIQKAKSLADFDFVSREGKKMGDLKAVLSAGKARAELFDNFNEKKNASDQVPHTEINITGDVTVVKPDSKNLTKEELDKLYKKYGISADDVVNMQENGEGIFEPEDLNHE